MSSPLISASILGPSAAPGKLKLSDFAFSGNPVTCWDVFGEQGHPTRSTVSEMGPLLFSRLLNLNDTQAGVLTLVFKIADDGGLLLLDLIHRALPLPGRAGPRRPNAKPIAGIAACVNKTLDSFLKITLGRIPKMW